MQGDEPVRRTEQTRQQYDTLIPDDDDLLLRLANRYDSRGGYESDAPFELAQYLSIRYTERLTQAGIEPSVGSTGDSYDDALAETVIGLFKTEEIHRRGPWKALEDVEFATLEWVTRYNGSRLLEPLGYVLPAEFEKARTAQVSASRAVCVRGPDCSRCVAGRAVRSFGAKDSAR